MGSSHILPVENFRTGVTALMQTIRDGVHNVCPIDEWACCYNENGTFNDDNFKNILISQEDDKAAAKKKFMNLLMDMIESASPSSIEHELPADTIEGPPMKRSQHVRTFKDPTTGVISPMTPHRSLWWMMYIQDLKVDDVQWNRLFRKRFQLPYNLFLELLRMLQPENFDSDEDDMFIRWRERNDNLTKKKTRVSPIELLLLGSLRHLGRGWTFNDLEELTFIARDVHRVFFHKFVEFGAKYLYPICW